MFSGTFDYDVIIIGAGLSGLTAAYTIYERDKNISCMILEGNDRIGGRVHSVSLNNSKNQKQLCDVGGQFVCKSQWHLMRLLEKLDVQVQENENNVGYTIGDFGDNYLYKTDSMPPIFGETAQAHDVIRFLGTLENLCSRASLENPLSIQGYNDLDTTTMEAFMYSNLTYSLSRQYLRILVKCICGAEPSEVSVLFFLAYCNSTEGLTNPYLRTPTGGKGCWIKHGAIQVCEKIAKAIGEDNIKINSAVESVFRTDFCAVVRTAEHEYKCRYVIVTIPSAQITAVNFYPPLTEAKNTIYRKMRSTSRIKFTVTYKRQFWHDLGLNGDVYCAQTHRDLYPVMMVYDISSDDSAILTGLLDAEYTDKNKCFRNETLVQLALYFGEEALEPLDYVEKFWSEQEHLFEGFRICFPPPKTMASFHEIRRPVGRLYFAGAETATYWYGHMAGAVQSGFRSAVEVLYEIRPQCLSSQDFIDLKPRRKQVQYYTTEEDVLDRDWVIVLFISSLVSYVIIKTVTVLQYMMRMFGFRRR